MNNYQFDIMERCDFMPLTAELASLPFCCGETEGDKDLEDFFHHNALLYAQERLGKTYCFVNNEGEFSEIVAFFTVSNDSVKTTFIPKPSANKVQRTIPGQKHLRTYPAVLLGRLGVNKKYQGRNFLNSISRKLLRFIPGSCSWIYCILRYWNVLKIRIHLSHASSLSSGTRGWDCLVIVNNIAHLSSKCYVYHHYSVRF